VCPDLGLDGSQALGLVLQRTGSLEHPNLGSNSNLLMKLGVGMLINLHVQRAYRDRHRGKKSRGE
jgi:hypothetical protein